ncbi:MAG: sugar ABC transporter ATP-binding protein [Synergistaceae bacterium]|jgi:ABC-type sugar transport system ATPase subunit|nr:sugar ABC transporter ATP-binding protein [Synergistaceae bacterium]
MTEALLELRKVSKAFPGVQALKDVDFVLHPGEVVALCGANGAGKSTAANLIAGIYQQDSGEIRIKQQKVSLTNPKAAERHGVGVVYQEPTLVPRMTVVENIFLGKEITRPWGKLDFAKMKREAKKTLGALGFALDVDRKVSSLTLVEREAAEIAKAVLLNPCILILDEVTAPLNKKEVDHLFEVIRNLKKQDIGMIFISHKLNECIEISDRIVVFRNGENVADLKCTETTAERDIICPMLNIGSLEGDLHDVVKETAGFSEKDELLRVEGLSNERNFQNMTFTLHKEEILGFAGLKGAGISELFFALQGVIPRTRGRMFMKGREIDPGTPYEGIQVGIGMLTHDRHKEGLALSLDVKSNIAVSSLGSLRNKFGFIDDRALADRSSQFVRKLEIKTPSLFQMVANLSGGNQQKTVMAKLLLRDLDVIIVDEPTRGVDIKAKSEIFKLLLEEKAEGKGIIAFSPECRELLSICDRILVVAEGKIVDEVARGTSRFCESALLEIIHSA